MTRTGVFRRRTPLLLLIITMALALTGLMPSADADPTAVAGDELVFPGLPEASLALIEADDHTTLSDLEGFHEIDLAHWHEETEDGTVLSAAFVTDDEIELLGELGVTVLDVDPLPTPDEADAQFEPATEAELDAALERQAVEARELELRHQALGDATEDASGLTAEAVPPPVDETEHLRVLRADTFTNYSGEFISVEVRSLFSDAPVGAADRPDRVRISYEDGGRTINRTLSTFVDAGQYIYHRLPRPVSVVGTPSELTVALYEVDEDGQGNEVERLVERVTVPTEPWAPYDSIGYPPGFQRAFVPGYLDSVDSTEAIFELADQFPDLAEIIELPHETAGYQRKAMALYADEVDGTPAASVINIESLEWGHEGGNDTAFEVVNDGTPNRPLEIDVTDDGGVSTIRVTVATDGNGATVTTVASLVAALAADTDASGLVRAFPYRDSGGTGPVAANLGVLPLSDFLNAPEEVPRGPRNVYALRIGAERDGSKTGVFAYSQEHAREWVTPVVAIETASRLLHNYGTDPDTTAFVDELDIFIVPTVNRDGTDYSRYDFASQRRNMTNYCPDQFSDANARNAWGVDLNRNFREYNLEQGYAGASTSCTSDVFAGPGPLSEPEAQNTAWMVEEHPNIRFSMNIHTHGGYFMWAPGSYAEPGRVPAPRPDLGYEDYFFAASETILGRIAEHRGTVIEPGRTGPIIDVLYSAAGNSADDLWYRGLEAGRPIFGWSFEAGANRFIGGRWQGVGGFFPDYTQEGFDQAMEFSNGIYGMLEVAHEFELDDQAPTTTPNVEGDVNYDGPADVLFASDEPAIIHYTTDGSEPTLDSPTVERRDARDGAAPIRITETTTLRWFGRDVADNVEEVQEITVYIDEDPPDGDDPDDG